mgnify:FL=1
MTDGYNRLALAGLLGLLALCLAWELWLAPLRPGGTLLALKALPLLLPLRGLLHGRRYTHQWASLLALLYLVEGALRAVSDPGASRWPALAEILLAAAMFAGCLGHARRGRPATTVRAGD